MLHGFETKNFFGSGLYELFSQDYKTLVLRRNFPTRNFDEYITRYNLDVIKLEDFTLKQRLKIEDLFLSSRRSRQRIKNIRNFNYFRADRERKLSDFLLGNKLVCALLGNYTMSQLPSYYHNKILESIYNNCGMTDLILPGYSSIESIALANTALKTGRNVWLVINSWKDFYVNDLIPFTPTKTFVWSQQMKNQLLSSNAHIDPASVITSGNPSFDRFFNYYPIHSKIYYAEKYRFDPRRPLILYTMISPKAYVEEKEIIESINKKLISMYPNENFRPIILLRRNPIDETIADEGFFTDNNIRYADNYFDCAYEDSVFVQLQEGEIEWMDLLYHADINMNIASTVTLEALMMATPVINIEFSAEGVQDDRLSRYTTAPFYLPLLERKDVAIAHSIGECFEAIDNYLKNDTIIEPLSPILDSFDGFATQRMIKEIVNL